MSDQNPVAGEGFFALACTRPVVISSLKVALVVGSILVLINHWPALAELSLSRNSALQVVLTYIVPYCVSTYSSVRSLQRHTAMHSEQE
ncbi:MAG: nitrate/nitrite transporter NrtS [Pseudomonadota bacterium]